MGSDDGNGDGGKVMDVNCNDGERRRVNGSIGLPCSSGTGSKGCGDDLFYRIKRIKCEREGRVSLLTSYLDHDDREDHGEWGREQRGIGLKGS